jgi:hypothetical protein
MHFIKVKDSYQLNEIGIYILRIKYIFIKLHLKCDD